MSHLRRPPIVASAVILAVVASTPTLVSTTAVAAGAPTAQVSATFAAPQMYRSHPAVTYDQRSVAKGSRVRVVEKPNDLGGVVVELSVGGLKPNTRYDAYVYTRPCGDAPTSAGKRTQDGPSTLHYSQNEVWLNFTTNVHGAAHSRVDQYWRFAKGRANSVVLLTGPVARIVACVTVPFT